MTYIENTAEFLLSRGHPDDVVMVDGGRDYSYAQLRQAVNTCAAELQSRGLPLGSRVGVLGSNSFFWVASYLAVLRLNLVAVPLSDKATPADLRRHLDVVGCTTVAADARCRGRFAPVLEHAAVLTEDVLESPARGPRPAAPRSDRDADAVLLFTSGTTARPKVVRLTHGNIQANTESITEFLGLERSDRVLVILPFFYCYGASLLHTHLRVGGRIVLSNGFAYPEMAVDLLEREACTVFAGVPSSFQMLLRRTTFATRRLPHLRMIQQAGGRLSPVLIRELLAVKPEARLFVMYGQTEATARLSYLPPERLPEKLGSIGRGIPGVELTVRDQSGRPVAIGEQGEIYARGASISPGYLGDAEATSATFTPLGLRTGDLAQVDEDGFIYIVDRRQDFIKSWGHRVSSQEIEDSVMGIPNLSSAAAVGVPDDTAGEAIVLFVTSKPGTQISPDEVLTQCHRRLAKHMVPASVLVLDDLPLNAHGKVIRSALRELVPSRSSS